MAGLRCAMNRDLFSLCYSLQRWYLNYAQSSQDACPPTLGDVVFQHNGAFENAFDTGSHSLDGRRASEQATHQPDSSNRASADDWPTPLHIAVLSRPVDRTRCTESEVAVALDAGLLHCFAHVQACCTSFQRATVDGDLDANAPSSQRAATFLALRRACTVTTVAVLHHVPLCSRTVPSSVYIHTMASLLLLLATTAEGYGAPPHAAPPRLAILALIRLLMAPTTVGTIMVHPNETSGLACREARLSMLHGVLSSVHRRLVDQAATLAQHSGAQVRWEGHPLRALWRGLLVCLEAARLCSFPTDTCLRVGADGLPPSLCWSLRRLGVWQELTSCQWILWDTPLEDATGQRRIADAWARILRAHPLWRVDSQAPSSSIWPGPFKAFGSQLLDATLTVLNGLLDAVAHQGHADTHSIVAVPVTIPASCTALSYGPTGLGPVQGGGETRVTSAGSGAAGSETGPGPALMQHTDQELHITCNALLESAHAELRSPGKAHLVQYIPVGDAGALEAGEAEEGAGGEALQMQGCAPGPVLMGLPTMLCTVLWRGELDAATAVSLKARSGAGPGSCEDDDGEDSHAQARPSAGVPGAMQGGAWLEWLGMPDGSLPAAHDVVALVASHSEERGAAQQHRGVTGSVLAAVYTASKWRHALQERVATKLAGSKSKPEDVTDDEISEVTGIKLPAAPARERRKPKPAVAVSSDEQSVRPAQTDQEGNDIESEEKKETNDGDGEAEQETKDGSGGVAPIVGVGGGSTDVSSETKEGSGNEDDREEGKDEAEEEEEDEEKGDEHQGIMVGSLRRMLQEMALKVLSTRAQAEARVVSVTLDLAQRAWASQVRDRGRQAAPAESTQQSQPLWMILPTGAPVRLSKWTVGVDVQSLEQLQAACRGTQGSDDGSQSFLSSPSPVVARGWLARMPSSSPSMSPLRSPAVVARPALSLEVGNGGTEDTGLPTVARLGSPPAPAALGLQVGAEGEGPVVPLLSAPLGAANRRRPRRLGLAASRTVTSAAAEDGGSGESSQASSSSEEVGSIPTPAAFEAGWAHVYPELADAWQTIATTVAADEQVKVLRAATPALAAGIPCAALLALYNLQSGAVPCLQSCVHTPWPAPGPPVHPWTGHPLSPRRCRVVIGTLSLLRSVCMPRPGTAVGCLFPLQAYMAPLEGLASLGGVPCIEAQALACIRPLVRHLGMWKRNHLNLMTDMYKFVPPRGGSGVYVDPLANYDEVPCLFLNTAARLPAGFQMEPVPLGHDEEKDWAETPSVMAALLAKLHANNAAAASAAASSSTDAGQHGAKEDEEGGTVSPTSPPTHSSPGKGANEVDAVDGHNGEPVSAAHADGKAPRSTPGLKGAQMKGMMFSLAKWAQTHPEQVQPIRERLESEARSSRHHVLPVSFQPEEPASAGSAQVGQGAAEGGGGEVGGPKGAVRVPVARRLSSWGILHSRDAASARIVERAVADAVHLWEHAAVDV